MSTNAPVVKEYDIPMTEEPYREPKRLPTVAPDRIVSTPIYPFRQPVPERVFVRRVR